MGWLSNIFKNKKPEPEVAGKVGDEEQTSLSKLVSIVSGKIQEKNLALEEEIKKMHEKILASSSEFSEAMNKLNLATGPEKIDDAIMNVAKSYRSSLVKSFNTTFMNFQKPVSYTAESFEEYLGRCSSSLAQAEEGAMKFIQPLKEVFPGEMKQVLKKSEQLNNVLSEIISKTGKISLEIRPFSEILSLARGLESEASRMAETENEASNMQRQVSELKAKKESLEQGVADFLSGPDWGSYQRRKQEILLAEKKKDEIRSIVIQSIGPLDKAMKRLRKILAEQKESFEGMDILELYISDPFDAFVRDSDQSVFNSIVSRIRVASGTGSLDIETKKEQKILERLSEVESGNLLASLRRDYDSLEQSSKALEEDVGSSEVLKTKLHYENEIKSLASQIPRDEEKLSGLSSKLSKIKEKKAEIFEKLKDSVRNVLGENLILLAI